jgi:hypothetical protein
VPLWQRRPIRDARRTTAGVPRHRLYTFGYANSARSRRRTFASKTRPAPPVILSPSHGPHHQTATWLSFSCPAPPRPAAHGPKAATRPGQRCWARLPLQTVDSHRLCADGRLGFGCLSGPGKAKSPPRALGYPKRLDSCCHCGWVSAGGERPVEGDVGTGKNWVGGLNEGAGSPTPCLPCRTTA